jgi:hypothetical protein
MTETMSHGVTAAKTPDSCVKLIVLLSSYPSRRYDSFGTRKNLMKRAEDTHRCGCRMQGVTGTTYKVGTKHRVITPALFDRHAHGGWSRMVWPHD